MHRERPSRSLCAGPKLFNLQLRMPHVCRLFAPASPPVSASAFLPCFCGYFCYLRLRLLPAWFYVPISEVGVPVLYV